MRPNKKPVEISRSLLRKWKLPDATGGDKNARGCALIVGGAPELPGAVILAATCALRAGAGKIQIATHRSIAQTVATIVPEALVTTLAIRNVTRLAKKADAILIGPGLAEGTATYRLVKGLRSHSRKTNVVFDAEALKEFRRKIDCLKNSDTEFVVTPHAGEMASMLGLKVSEIEKNPAVIALEFASRSGAITVLKGPKTYIATPTGDLYRNNFGNAGLGTSGSGDCLAGIIAGLAARGTPLLHAAVWGVYLHGRAGEKLAKEIGPLGYLAREIPLKIPKIMAEITARK